MTSAINPAVPQTGQTPASSADLRNNFAAAKEEIEDLQQGVETASSALSVSKFSIDYGIIGNDANDDTEAVQELITAAGIGGVINFSPNLIMKISNELTFLPKQTIYKNGSKFKRANQVYTTLTADSPSITAAGIAAGTVLSVTDSNQFQVGREISITHKNMNTAAGVACYAHYTRRATITEIPSATSIKIGAIQLGSASTSDVDASLLSGGGFDTSYVFPAGSIVAQVFTLVRSVEGVVFDRLEIDGNRANQFGGAFWDVCSDVLCNPAQGSIDPIVFTMPTVYESMSEAFLEASGGALISPVFSGTNRGIIYDRPVVYNCNGNPFHTSGINNPLIYFMDVKNVNCDLSVGHVGGAIALSWSGQRLSVQGGNVDGAYSALGRAYLRINSQIKFSGVTVQNTYWRGFDAYGGSDEGDVGVPYELSVNNSTFKNAGIIGFGTNDSRTSDAFLRDCDFSSNKLIGTTLRLQYASLKVDNNKIRNNYIVPSTIASATTFNQTTVIVASATNYKKGQSVFLGRKGVRSRMLVIKSISGTTIEFSTSVGATSADNIGANSYLYDADGVPTVRSTSFTCLTTDYVLTLPDTTLFSVNNYFMVSSVTEGTLAPASIRIKAIDHAAGTITLSGQIGIAYTAKVVEFWPVGFSPDFQTNIQINNCAPQITNNETDGGFGGMSTGGATTGLSASNNNFLNIRAYGIQAVGSATAVEKYSSNLITLATNAASWARGFWGTCKVEATNISITTTQASHIGLEVTAGDHGVYESFKIRGAGTAAVSVTNGAANTHLINTGAMAAATITNSATGSPTTTGSYPLS